MRQGIKIGGIFEVWAVDKDGNEKWRVKEHNLVTNQGLNHILDAVLHGSTQITTWYVAPFEDNHTVAAGDTYATPGYTECTAYTEANRQAYVEAAASGQSITNSASPASLSINATKTIYGAALVGGGTGADTKGDAAGGGTLLCAVQFASSKAVESGDTLNITYTLSAADDGA